MPNRLTRNLFIALGTLLVIYNFFYKHETLEPRQFEGIVKSIHHSVTFIRDNEEHIYLCSLFVERNL